jgi:ferredoxin
MGIMIFYYTGTGNSLWVARRLADELGDAEIISMSGHHGWEKAADGETVGLVFPVYIWGVPAPVLKFVSSLKGRKRDYTFAVATNGGQVSNTLVQLKRVMAENGLSLSSGFGITMPSNYIPWGGPGPKERQEKKFEQARKKISFISGAVRGRANLPVEKGPLWQRALFTFLYNITFSRVPEMDKPFHADERCNACGICSRVCPASNITLPEGRPVWHHRCEQCFACLQWCPQEAIQYGKKTAGYERYHHPEIILKDVLKEP